MITESDYFRDGKSGGDRRVMFERDLTPMIEENAEVIIAKANLLLTKYQAATGDDRRRKINSGWRPPAINGSTPNASSTSRHMTAEAIDIFDYEDEALDNWLMSDAGEAVLVELGLWHEHPDYLNGENATNGWCHVQTVPTRSNNRHFKAK